jgi:archaeal cell division control protein 6
MANVFEKDFDKGLLKDERYLYPDYVPERLPFRDSEIDSLVFSLKPATIGKNPTNIFVFGKPGTGKTVTLKFVLNELTEYSDRAKCLYINCFETGTRHSILAKATNAFGYAIPHRGFGAEEIYERFVALIKSKQFVPIIVFDEAEQLLRDEETKKLLYDLSRLGEQKKVFLGMVFISNDEFFLSQLDDRVRSSLQSSTIKFEQYAPSQLKEILNERVKYAFHSNALEEEVVPLCAAHSAKNGGDARIAINILLKAGRLAEKEGSKKVMIKHVRNSFMQEKLIKDELVSNFTEQEKLILDFIGNKEYDSGEIYSHFKNKFAERTLRKAISTLEEKKVIQTKKIVKGRGFTRLIKKA